MTDKRIYNLAQAFWRRKLSAFAGNYGLTYQSYLNPDNGKGQKEYDANPIFDAYFPDRKKAVRIIQDEPELGAPDLAAWLDDSDGIPELVIALSLSRETEQTVLTLLEKWIGEDWETVKMKTWLERFVEEQETK